MFAHFSDWMRNSGGKFFLIVGVALIFGFLALRSCETSTPPPPGSESGDIYLTWAAANLRAQSAQETAQAVAAQVTRQAQVTHQARDAYWFSVTQTAVAWDQENQRAHATATAGAQATATAVGYARETVTAVAQATATAEYHVRETATAVSYQTAVAPTIAIVQAELERALTQEKWRQATVPVEHIVRLVLWITLIVVAIAILVWTVPRAWHTLMLLALRTSAGKPDKPVLTLITWSGFLRPWLRAPTVLTYDFDRDEGPGVRVNLETGDAHSLPGGSPEVARGDQFVDLYARAAALGRLPASVGKAAERALQSPPPYRILSSSEPPASIAGALPQLSEQWARENDDDWSSEQDNG